MKNVISVILCASALTIGCSSLGMVDKESANNGMEARQSSKVANDQLLPSPLPGLHETEDMEDNEIIIEDPLALTGDVITSDVEAEVEMSDVESREDPQTYLDAALQRYEESQALWNSDNPEGAIASLDEAYQNILQVTSGLDPEMDQQGENLRFMISKRILEIYSARHTTANGSSDAIPLIMNSYVERELKLFQNQERPFFMSSFKRSGKYRDKIMQSLKEAGLPEELSWLPLIESGFKVNALSRARALGLWQFIPSTGYKFGLSRDPWIDERLDPEKSTVAAIAYLKELHQIFGDWTTVLAAYNCGETRVLKLIRSQKISYLDNFWDLYERLPVETARYVPRFMATLHILKDPAKYGFDLDEVESPDSFEIVTVEKEMSLKVIAQEIKVPLDELAILNPVLRHKITPRTPYELKIPEGSGPSLMAKMDAIPSSPIPTRAYTIHRVRQGETLSQIAQRYRTSVGTITRMNNIHRKHMIKIGQRLKVPESGVRTHQSYNSETDLSPGGTYRVRRGDSLWSIARRFNKTMDEIKKLNQLESSTVYLNQQLKISKL